MANDADAQDIPRRALFRGKPVRISHYEGDGKFVIYDRYDDKRTVHRSRLTFLPDRKKTTQRQS